MFDHSMDRLRSGTWHIPSSAEISAQKELSTRHLKRFNDLANTDDEAARTELAALLAPDSAIPGVFAPIYVDYGVNIRFGEGCFVNFNCVFLDTAEITIGRGTLFGPACQIITVEHPVNDVVMRRKEWERARPITIGDDCWFGAGAMVMPGVTVGDRCVIAAGSVVTRDVPSDSLVVGTPGVVKRKLNQGGDHLEREDLTDPEERASVDKQD